MKIRIIILLCIPLITSCVKKTDEATNIYGKWELVKISGDGETPPVHKPGKTSFVFNKRRTITVLENNVANQTLNGTLKFDPDNKRMIWIHLTHTHPPLKRPYILEGQKLFYENPEGYMMYFKKAK